MAKIEEIKNRLDATTPGVWAFSVPEQSLVFSPPEDSVQVQTGLEKFGYVQVKTEGGEACDFEESHMKISRADIEFMAHAREYVDYLLKLVEKIAEAIPADAVK